MSLDANPNHYEQASASGSTYDAMRDVWWWINGTHPTEANSIPWACVDCYDGTTREQPTDGDMSNLTGGNLWKPSASPSGSLPADAWATFRNPGGCVAAFFQIFVKMEASSQASNSLIPLDDWSVGGGTDASPTLPATIIGQPAVGDGDGRFTNQATYIWSVIMDGGMFYMRMMAPSGINALARFTYMGECNPWNPVADDPRPFLTMRSTAQANFPTSFSMVRLSPIDSSTVLNVNDEVFFSAVMDSATPFDELGPDYICSILVYTNTASHRFVMGQLRNVGAIGQFATASRATCGVGPTDFQFEVWSRSMTEAGIVSKWVPGTALAAGHTEIADGSIPVELKPASGGGDTTRPVVAFVTPVPGAQIRPTTAITIDVTDDSGGFANLQLRVSYPSADPVIPTETIYGGDRLGEFEAFYESSTVAAITDGFRFVLTRDEGWPSTPTFVASPIDPTGNTV